MPVPVRDIPIDAVERGEVLRYLGHRGQELGEALEERLDVAVARALEVARPRAALRTFEVAGCDVSSAGVPELRLAGCALLLEGRDIAAHLKGADIVGVMAVTLGMGVERELQRLSLSGDALEQVLFDAAATAVVERAADGAEALLVGEAVAQGMGATGRFSPGYGDLPLSCQGVLLASVDATRRLGITLTASSLLVPTKSVTAVMGLGANVVRGRRQGCATCGLRDFCSVRAAGEVCRSG